MTKTTEETALAKLEQTIEEHSIVRMVDMNPAAQALALSQGITAVAKALEPLTEQFLHLAGDSLGFRMDKQYPKEEVKKAMVEALLRGLPLTGNCFNVIQGRCYVTREGYLHLVKNYPGLTDLRFEVGEPDAIKPVANSKSVAAYMPFHASWKLNGQPAELDGKFYVRMYGGNDSFYDGLVGKATRRGLRAVYETIVGTHLAPPDSDDLEEEGPVTVEAEVVKDIVQEQARDLVADIEEQITQAEDADTLQEISDLISSHIEAGDLPPSGIKRLREAYTAAVDRIEEAA